MTRIPSEIKVTFDRVRKEYPFYVALLKINNKFYVYRRSSKWDKKTRQRKSISEYLGRIDDEGNFLKKVAPEKIEEKPKKSTNIESEGEIDETDVKLLTIQSMNARSDISYLSRKLAALKPSTTFYRIKNLEQRYKIKYLSEVDTEKLGFTEYLAFIKFEDKLPTTDDLKEFEKEKRVQLVASLSGEYDFLVYFLAENNDIAADTVYTLRKGPLANYPSKWYITPFKTFYGYVPLREIFFELLEEKVWKRRQGITTMKQEDLRKREYFLLKELNENGKVDFREIDKKYKLGENASYYTYRRLLETGIIKRVTLTSEKLPFKYNALILLEVINQELYEGTRSDVRLNIISDYDPRTNNYVLEGDVGNPNGVLFIAPIFSEGQFNHIIDVFNTKIKGVRLRTLIITSVIIGRFCYRKFDNAYSRQYISLVKTKKIAPQKQINYEETGRSRITQRAKDVKNEDDINVE